MKTPKCLIVLPLLTLAIGAQEIPAPQLPDRPAAAITRYKGDWIPVVGADFDAPVVMDSGKPVTLGKAAPIMITLGEAYAPGFVTIASVYTSDVPVANDAATAAQMATDMRATVVLLVADLSSDVTVPDAYALLVACPPGLKPGDPPQLAAMVHRIGELAAGKPFHLSVRLPKITQEEGPGWCVLVCSEGRQLRSTGMDMLLPGYFDRLENVALRRRIEARADKGVDAPIAVFRQMPLGLPDEVRSRYRGMTVNVDVRVNLEGRVVWVKPINVNDPELTTLLMKGFATWLFLPPVREGSLASGKVIVPIKL